MGATCRARTGRSRAQVGPASSARAVSRRGRGRLERSPPDQHRWPAAPAKSWQGEGSGTRPQGATRRTRSWVSALGKAQPRFAQALAAQGHIQSVREEALASRRIAGKQAASRPHPNSQTAHSVPDPFDARPLYIMSSLTRSPIPAPLFLGALFLRLRREQQWVALFSARIGCVRCLRFR
jgi:hypothetical protein